MKVPLLLTIIDPTPVISAIVPEVYVTAVFVPIPATVNCVTVNEAVPVSISVSFVNKLPAIAVFSGVVNDSLFTVGKSFTGVTVIFTLAVFVAVPSETVYVIAGTGPL